MGQIIAAPFSCSFFVFSDGQLDKETSDSLLPIIASQRERFRTRNLELETVCTFLYNKRTRFQGEKPGFRNVVSYKELDYHGTLHSLDSNTRHSCDQIFYTINRQNFEHET